MDQSSGCFESGLEWHSGMDDGPEDIHSASCQGDDGCVVSFSFAALSVIEGATVVVAERAEGGLVEDPLQTFVSPIRPSQEAHPSGLSQHRGHSRGGGEGVCGAEELRRGDGLFLFRHAKQ
jgi:hypothetical protein